MQTFAGLQADFFAYLEAEGVDIKNVNLFSGFFIMDKDENHLKKKK